MVPEIDYCKIRDYNISIFDRYEGEYLMKKILKNSMLIGAAVLGVASVAGSSYVVKAAGTPTQTSLSSSATANLQPGTIQLLTVPNIDFGTVKSSANDVTYESSTFSSGLEVANPGEPTGWNVVVSSPGFAMGTPTDTPTTAVGQTLLGAKLSIKDSVESPVHAVDADNVSVAPVFTSSIPITTAPAPVLNAPADTGVGAFMASFNNSDASLSVPAGNIGGSYSAILDWTLSNAPA